MSHVCDGRDHSCASCQAIGRRLAAVRGAMTVDDDLDDIRRARIWTQLEDRLAEGAPARRSRLAIAFGGVAAAAVAVAAVIALWPHRDELHTLTVPVDTVVASRLGPHTAASIVGPAELELLPGAGDATAVRLHRGTLLAEFDGGAGRSLRVETRGAIVEVVGTLFAVEVRGGTTCTSVVHGRVRVTTAAGAVAVGAGERHCTGDVIRPISDDVRTALLRHSGRSERGTGAAELEAQPPQPSGEEMADRRSPHADPPAAPVQAAAVPPQPTAVPPTRTGAAPAQAAGTPSRTAAAPRPPDAALPTRTGAAAPTRTGAAPPHAPASSMAAAVAPQSAAVPPTQTAAAPSQPAGMSSRTTAAPPPPEAAPSTAAASPPRASGDAPARVAGPRPTPDELYRAAETALAARDLAVADRALAALVTEYPASTLVDQALYERARIAYQQHAWGAARSHLAQLAAMSSAPFAEPGHYLRCRIAVETGEASASTCLVDYRAAFPRSPHDLDALALLVQLAHASSGCRGAAALIDELVQSYPRTTLAAAWRGRCPEQP